MRFVNVKIALFGAALAACGRQPQSGITTSTSIRSVAQIKDFHFEKLGDNETYQIGTEMGKYPVTADVLKKESDLFRRAAKATAYTGNATAFYLGTFNGYHMMASNHHVYERASQCLNRTLRFPFLGNKGFVCKKFFGSWSDVDLSLFAIEVKKDDDLKELEAVAKNFDFKGSIKQKTPLMTFGFGIANNRTQKMMYNQDSDCKVFSADDDFRFLGDPDELNPGTYKAWSFSVGCDVSHGDSGSAMVDKETGDIIGLLWTGKIPKNPVVRNEGYTDKILKDNSEDIWKELTLAVPAPKIGDFLQDLANNQGTDADTAKTLKALLD